MDHNPMDPSKQPGTLRKPNEEYVKVKAADGYTYYIAHALMEKVLGEGCEVWKLM